MVKALITKSDRYNETLEYISRLEKEEKIYVIRPKKPVTISRTEKNIDKLKSLYIQGYIQALEEYDKVLEYLSK